MSKETYYSVKRDLLLCQKRPTTVSKETYYYRDLLQCQKRPTTVSKETYYYRDLLLCQKRPTTISKRVGQRGNRCGGRLAFDSIKRDLLLCHKRPTTVSKETYYSVKRDLLQWVNRCGGRLALGTWYVLFCVIICFFCVVLWAGET